jgi:hypothetical protein
VDSIFIISLQHIDPKGLFFDRGQDEDFYCKFLLLHPDKKRGKGGEGRCLCAPTSSAPAVGIFDGVQPHCSGISGM